jgi:hypothetical protein
LVVDTYFTDGARFEAHVDTCERGRDWQLILLKQMSAIDGKEQKASYHSVGAPSPLFEDDYGSEQKAYRMHVSPERSNGGI